MATQDKHEAPMTPRFTRHNYAQPVIDDLVGIRRRTSSAVTSAMLDSAIDFLKRRMTDAAKAGCHHCDEERDRPAPCRWCGLKGKGR